MEKLAIEGGKPVRDSVIRYGHQWISDKDIAAVNEVLRSDFLTTGAFIPLVLGFLWSRGTSTAAITSMLFGFLFSTYNLFAALGFNLPVAWEIASAEQAIIGISISLLLYIGISLFTKDDMVKSNRFIKKANILNR